MDIFHMSDVISLIGLPYPPSGHSTYNIPCPCCDDKPGKKHLNINLKKDVFRCPRCGFSGGVFDLYAHYAGIPREEVREALIARLNVQGTYMKLKVGIHIIKGIDFLSYNKYTKVSVEVAI